MGSCFRQDVILPLVIVGFVRRAELEFEELFEEILDGQEFVNIFKYIEWIRKEEWVLGQRAINAFKVFENYSY